MDWVTSVTSTIARMGSTMIYVCGIYEHQIISLYMNHSKAWIQATTSICNKLNVKSHLKVTKDSNVPALMDSFLNVSSNHSMVLNKTSPQVESCSFYKPFQESVNLKTKHSLGSVWINIFWDFLGLLPWASAHLYAQWRGCPRAGPPFIWNRNHIKCYQAM